MSLYIPTYVGPGGVPLFVPIPDTYTSNPNTTTTAGDPKKGNVFTQVLGAIPAVLGALFPRGVTGNGGYNSTGVGTGVPYYPAANTSTGLNTTTLLLAGVVVWLLLSNQPKRR